jgi:hypothetical protein
MDAQEGLLEQSIDYSAFPTRRARLRIRRAFIEGTLERPIEIYRDLINFINSRYHEPVNEPLVRGILGIGKCSAELIIQDLTKKGLLRHITSQEDD